MERYTAGRLNVHRVSDFQLSRFCDYVGILQLFSAYLFPPAVFKRLQE